MYGGFPHRMRFKVFNARYRALAEPIRRLKGTENKAVEDCEFIIDCYNRTKADNSHKNNQEWAHGRKYIFLSEGARQELEVARNAKRLTSAIKIQHFWRRRKNVKNNVINNNITNWNQHCQNHKPRPKPISCTPPLPLNDIIHSDRCDFRIIQQTCSLFGLDLVIYKTNYFSSTKSNLLIYRRDHHLYHHPDRILSMAVEELLFLKPE